MARNPMEANLPPLIAALAELDDAELHALITATNKATQIAPGLLAWIEDACDWELNRRPGLDYPLLLPAGVGVKRLGDNVPMDRHTARKLKKSTQPLLEAETTWIQAAIKQLIWRVGDQRSGAALPRITMADLPPL